MDTATQIFTDLTTSPSNRVLHFGLELAVWISVGAWGWGQGQLAGWLLAAALPLLVVVTWTAFAVPNDPWLPGGPDGQQPWVVIPGWARLLFEVAVHGIAAWALLNMGWTRVAIILGLGFVLHYAVSYQRIVWLFGR